MKIRNIYALHNSYDSNTEIREIFTLSSGTNNLHTLALKILGNCISATL